MSIESRGDIARDACVQGPVSAANDVHVPVVHATIGFYHSRQGPPKEPPQRAFPAPVRQVVRSYGDVVRPPWQQCQTLSSIQDPQPMGP